MTNEELLMIEIQNRHTEANAAVVNAVTALREALAQQTRQIQRASEWHPEDTGGVSGGIFDYAAYTNAATALAGGGWRSVGRVGGDSPPGYKSVTLRLNRGRWVTGTTQPIGIVARIRYAVENQFQSEVLVDVPAGGLLSVPFCGAEATVELLLTQIAFTAIQMQETDGTVETALSTGIGWPNYPQPESLNLAESGYSTFAPIVKVGMSAYDSIARTTTTLPSRKVSVYAASGDGAFPLYIPEGTQAFILQGPADATYNQRDVSANFPAGRIDTPVTPNVITQLMPGVQFIECASAGGGFFSATFFLGT